MKGRVLGHGQRAMLSLRSRQLRLSGTAWKKQNENRSQPAHMDWGDLPFKPLCLHLTPACGHATQVMHLSRKLDTKSRRFLYVV